MHAERVGSPLANGLKLSPVAQRGLVLLAVLAAVWSGASSAPPGASAPWTRVPEFPSGCYGDLDDFREKITAAQDALALEIANQERVNDKLKDKVNSIDPMELANLQQQYMMEHPDEAMKLMQRNQQLGEDFADAELRNEGNWKKLLAELDTLRARYKADLDKELGPIDAKFKDLDARAQKDLVAVGETWAYAPWAIKEWNELTVQANRGYERVCAEWWAASGPFHGWLEKYREHLVRDQVPRREEADAVGAGFMVQIVGTPTESFKSTATLVAVKEYAEQALGVFALRRNAPGKTQ